MKMSDNGTKKNTKTRGMTLIEVLVAIVLLVLVFTFVAENMIASSWAESKSSQRSMNVSAANYFMALVSGDKNLWAGYPDTPVDACGNPLVPVTDAGPKSAGVWHTAPNCNLAPPEVSNVQYQWNETVPVQNSANLTVWVKSTVGGRIDQIRATGFHPSDADTIDAGHTAAVADRDADADAEAVTHGHADAHADADRDPAAHRDAVADRHAVPHAVAVADRYADEDAITVADAVADRYAAADLIEG